MNEVFVYNNVTYFFFQVLYTSLGGRRRVTYRCPSALKLKVSFVATFAWQAAQISRELIQYKNMVTLTY